MNQEQKTKIERRICFLLGLLMIFPFVSGISGLAGIDNPLYSLRFSSDIILDSNLRFLNGMSVGIAVSVYVILPRISRETTAFRILMAAFMCGAAGRTLAALTFRDLPPSLIGLILIELISPAILIYYQSKIKD